MNQLQLFLNPAHRTHELIIEKICPENHLELEIIRDTAWIEGAFWGKPRRGHPEGQVLLHIQEVLKNVHHITNDLQTRQQLRLITILHDTFKYLEARSGWTTHHAVFARQFAAQFITDTVLLDIIELHDEAYYAWRNTQHQQYEKAQQRLQVLQERVGENMQLYYLFFKCDTHTGDKTLEPVHWFETISEGLTLFQF